MTDTRRLTCYRISDDAPRLVAARADRSWMSDTMERFAYRCLPLTIANSAGWELLCPVAFSAEWNGGVGLDDIVVSSEDPDIDRFAASHFGHGVLTMFTHYLFRTEPGEGLWVRGVPNRPKDGISPLDGIVETDWLDFPFTMNWKFTRPGIVSFAKDEPFCFVTPCSYRSIERVVPTIVPIESDREIAAAYQDYVERRADFNRRLEEREAGAVEQKWQKWYFRGERPDGTPGNELHVARLRAAEPIVETRAPPGSGDERES